MKALGITTAIFLAFIAGMHLGNSLAFKPDFVGFGCENATGPLYAMQEHDFPICQAIEPTDYIYYGGE